MLEAMFAVALANAITAAPGLWARATWGQTRPNVELRIENRSKVVASLVDVSCKAYDATGVVVAAPVAHIAWLDPGAATHTWATDDGGSRAVRFACNITVDHWQWASPPRAERRRPAPEAAAGGGGASPQ